MSEDSFIPILILIAVILIISVIVYKSTTYKPNVSSVNNNIENNRIMGNQNQNVNTEDDSNIGPEVENMEEDIDRNNNQQIDPNKNYTKKELHKMEKKKQKADQREQMEEYLKQKKLKEIEKEKIYLEKEAKRREDELKEEEMVKKLKEEKEKKEQLEYEKWEKNFTINEEGEEKVDFNDELINKFIEYITLRKVVSLEDLGAHFKLSPSEAAQKIGDLELSGKLSGIIDDRGKFIYITEKEYANIEKFIATKGRISKTDLVTQCNKLIRFEPTEEDRIRIDSQNKEILVDFQGNHGNQ